MSVRTNRMKAVLSVKKRLTRVMNKEKDPTIVKKLDKLMSELNSIKDLFSTVKGKEDQLLDTLKFTDDLLRNFNCTEKIMEIFKCISRLDDAKEDNRGKGIDLPSSSQEAENKRVEKDATIEEKLEILKSELDNMKAMFSTPLKKNEELRKKLRVVEDFLRNFNPKPVDDANQSETKGLPSQTSREELVDQASKATGMDQPASSQEAQDKKTEEKNTLIDEKLESLKSKLDKMKEMFSNVKKNEQLRGKLRAMKDHLRNFNAKSLAEIVKPEEDSNLSETKGLEKPSQGSREELPSQTSREESVDQDFKAISDDKPSSSQEPQVKKTVESEETKGLELPSQGSREELPSQTSREELADQVLKANSDDKPSSSQEAQNTMTVETETKGLQQPSQGSREELLSQTAREELVDQDLVDQDFKAISNDDKPSSSREAQDKKTVEEDVPMDEMLESLKSELDNMKAKFSTVKEKEELHNTLRAMEDLLQNFNTESLAEIVTPAEDANQSEQTKGVELPSQTSREEMVDPAFKAIGVDKPSSSQEAQDESVEEDDSLYEKLERLKSEIDNMKAKLSTMKKNKELSDMLRALEDLLQNSNKKSSAKNVKRADFKEDLVDQVMKAISKKIKESTKKLGVSQGETEPNDLLGQGKAPKPVQYPTLSLSQYNDELNLVLKRFQASYDALNIHSKVCCLSLSLFPENVVIKKRHIIYWWIGEGFVKRTTEKKTAEEEVEDVFEELLNSNLIVPHGNGKSPLVNKFKIIPWIRHMLVQSVLGESKQPFGIYSQIIAPSHHHDGHACLVLDQHKVKISGGFDLKFDHWRSVFNVSASYLNIEPQWMAKMKKLVVLQLGRWQESPSHHIEVDSAEFMKNLKAQKHLKYLSLRGISRISELPASIAQLVSLQILDLKACHNLETLPNEIVLLRKLTHLDVSECYLLESMPKGIEKLTELQVLKGFVVGNSSKTPRISDLAKLKNLKRLSIHIGSEAVIQEGDFERLKELSAVKCLKISWGVLSNRGYKDVEIFLPIDLEKLDIEGFPSEKTPQWLKPINLPRGLKKLYITGGKLTSMGHEKKSSMYSMQIVRLKHLKNLQIDLKKLKEMFPSLKYAEGKGLVSSPSFEWSIEEGESMSMS